MRMSLVQRMQYHQHPHGGNVRHRLKQQQQQQQHTTASIMDYSQAKFLIFWILYLLNVANGEIILRVDPLALLSATLRTYQKAACDTDQVVIACPRGTSISIEFAQYNKFIAKDGISIDELCPADTDSATQIRSKAKHLLRGSTFGSPTQKVPANRYVNGGYGLSNPIAFMGPAASAAVEVTSPGASAAATDVAKAGNDGAATATDAQLNVAGEDNTPENCMWPNALQYSLLQTVVEACQKKKHCKFNATPHYYGLGASGVGDTSGTSSYHSNSSTASSSTISVDPCPKRRKIVEVAYKCRPYEFRSKVACHNDVAQLECNPYSRIAVYSASFGRTEYESIQCPQPQGVREETCLASYATETVMQICHGRRRCNLAADANTFGSPCQPNSRMYLKVVYTCVPKQVLKDRYESETEADEPEDFEGDINELYDDELIYKESEAIPKLYSNTTATATRSNATNSATTVTSQNGGANNSLSFEAEGGVGGVNPVMTHSADLSLEDDQERLYLYLLIAGSVGVILCIIIVAVRVILQKRHGAGTDTHSTSSIKGAGGGMGVSGCAGAETTIPNGFNDTISEIDADIDLTTPIPVPSVSKNENYITYAPTTSLYGSLGPSNISHTSSTLLLQGGAITNGGGGGGGGTPGLIANPLMCGPRQSPDIIGISSNTPFAVATSCASGGGVGQGGILTPAILIGTSGGGGTAVVSTSGVNCGTSAIGTMVPLSSLAQYTTAPTFRTGYIINPDGILQRPTNTPTPPTSISSGGATYAPCQSMQQQQQQQQQHHQQQQHQQQQQQLSSGSHLSATSTLRRTAKNNMLQQQPSYDGTAPRTLSTGVPVNSQFYYG